MARPAMQRHCRHLADVLDVAQSAQPQQLVSLASFSACSTASLGSRRHAAHAAIALTRSAPTATVPANSALAHAVRGYVSQSACIRNQLWGPASRRCRAPASAAAVAAAGSAAPCLLASTAARGFATRAAPQRRTGTGGWRNTPTHQALYLVSSCRQLQLVAGVQKTNALPMPIRMSVLT